MTPIDATLAFTLAALLMTLTPGLDTALVLRTAAVEGPKRGMQAGAGICIGVLAWGVMAAVGLGAVLAVSQFAYETLRIIGAAWLIWMGISMIRGARTGGAALDATATAAAPRARGQGWFMRGLLTNLLNPKVGVFYVTFLPQFIPAGGDVLTWSLAFAGIHAVEGLLWFLAITLATRRLASVLRRGAVVAWLDRVTGGVLVLFGLKLAVDVR